MSVKSKQKNNSKQFHMEKKRNLWAIPTDKPSRLFITDGKLFNYHKPQQGDGVKIINVNIYITSDGEIKEDYVIAYGVVIKVMMFDKETLYFVNGTKAKRDQCKKIILTTDQDLINDGVQAIDDEFLEWFVKNPSCENILATNLYGDFNPIKYKYKIIIPKEEPKQETLEEAVKPLMKWLCENTHPHTTVIVRSNSAELVEGIKSIETNEFLTD